MLVLDWKTKFELQKKGSCHKTAAFFILPESLKSFCIETNTLKLCSIHNCEIRSLPYQGEIYRGLHHLLLHSDEHHHISPFLWGTYHILIYGSNSYF